ncbi:MAG: hypothetical protein H6658_07810 [Ardenticatenaceae bacterium]|nr:hypothetical protein [Ardenticatenaceae bacterium]
MLNVRKLILSIIFAFLAFAIGNYLGQNFGNAGRWFIILAVIVYYIIWWWNRRSPPK